MCSSPGFISFYDSFYFQLSHHKILLLNIKEIICKETQNLQGIYSTNSLLARLDFISILKFRLNYSKENNDFVCCIMYYIEKKFLAASINLRTGSGKICPVLHLIEPQIFCLFYFVIELQDTKKDLLIRILKWIIDDFIGTLSIHQNSIDINFYDELFIISNFDNRIHNYYFHEISFSLRKILKSEPLFQYCSNTSQFFFLFISFLNNCLVKKNIIFSDINLQMNVPL